MSGGIVGRSWWPEGIATDGRRFVAWRLVGAGEGDEDSEVLDTKTMTTYRPPGCQLTDGDVGVFVALCQATAGAPRVPMLYDARTHAVRDLPGSRVSDSFFYIGRRWAAGTYSEQCSGDKGCTEYIVDVDWRTGQRLVPASCWWFEEQPPCDNFFKPNYGFDLDHPKLRPLKRDPHTEQGNLSVTRTYRKGLFLRRGHRRPVRLAPVSGTGDDFCQLACVYWLADRKLTWSNDDRPQTPAGTVVGFDADSHVRAAWRFRLHTGALCPRQYPYLTSLHTHYAVIALVAETVDQSPAQACSRQITSLAAYAARWPARRNG